MQSADNKLYRSSLLLKLRRYTATVHNMEQTVLLPSLLREVPVDDGPDAEGSEAGRDLYEHYLMLKSARHTVESGLIPYEDGSAKEQAALHKSLEPLLEGEPEALFHFHLRGLFSVMAHLTKESQYVTEKYLDIVGIGK